MICVFCVCDQKCSCISCILSLLERIAESPFDIVCDVCEWVGQWWIICFLYFGSCVCECVGLSWGVYSWGTDMLCFWSKTLSSRAKKLKRWSHSGAHTCRNNQPLSTLYGQSLSFAKSCHLWAVCREQNCTWVKLSLCMDCNSHMHLIVSLATTLWIRSSWFLIRISVE